MGDMAAKADQAARVALERDDSTYKRQLKRDIQAATTYRSRINCRELVRKAIREFKGAFHANGTNGTGPK